MNYSVRQDIYRNIERDRDTKVLSFITSDRQGMETAIAQDCINPFVDLLEQIGPTKRISLILHTNGGQTLAAWRLVNLIRMFCDNLEVLVPLNALSAGTLIAIGADRVVMTKQAALGPIDPSVNNPLNPQASIGGQLKQVPVSVESVRGYLDAAREELKIKGEEALTSVLLNLTNHIHPLVLGEILRAQAQIRFLAGKLLSGQVRNEETLKSIIDFLCADSGSHDYTINRREASELGLQIEGEEALTSVLLNLTNHIHPLVLGEILRAQAQIRFLAGKLLSGQVRNEETLKSIIDFLCADSGSHDYTINRREASELGLQIEKPSEAFYKLLRKVHLSYTEELKLLEPYAAQTVLGGAAENVPVSFSITRGLVEGTVGGCYGFVSEGTLTRVQIQTSNGPQEGIKDDRTFEGWRKLK